ncbi:MAG: hypothetical protein ACR2N1_15675 [Rubripirellula sp.]
MTATAGAGLREPNLSISWISTLPLRHSKLRFRTNGNPLETSVHNKQSKNTITHQQPTCFYRFQTMQKPDAATESARKEANGRLWIATSETLTAL